jgi:hypothetical protein
LPNLRVFGSFITPLEGFLETLTNIFEFVCAELSNIYVLNAISGLNHPDFSGFREVSVARKVYPDFVF